MLIESYAPRPDAIETHSIDIAAASGTVYHALWTADLGNSAAVKALLVLRSLPELIIHPKRRRQRSQKLTLHTLIDAGFGLLAEEPGREVVLGVTGRFWRPAGNLEPFRREDFDGPVPHGQARAVWNFTVQQASGRTILRTETRVVCGDTASRLKFRAYWSFVRPFSGLIRMLMLRAVRRASETAL